MAPDETDTVEIPMTKVQWGLRGAQILFAFLAMATISAVIGWDSKFFSASIFSVLFLFIITLTILVAAALVAIPHFYNKQGKFQDAARALRIPRIAFVFSAIWAVLILLVTFLLTIDAYLLRKCDPMDQKYVNENYTTGPLNQTFIDGLPRICRTQRAADVFGWLALLSWGCSLALIANDWRKSRRPPQQQGPITYSKPSSSSKTSLGEQGLPDTSTRPTQENVPMQTIHSTTTPYHPPQQPQQHTFSTPSPSSFPQPQHQPPPHQSPPSLAPIPGPMPTFPEAQVPGQGQGQGQGQSPGISFPEPHHYT